MLLPTASLRAAPQPHAALLSESIAQGWPQGPGAPGTASALRVLLPTTALRTMSPSSIQSCRSLTLGGSCPRRPQPPQQHRRRRRQLCRRPPPPPQRQAPAAAWAAAPGGPRWGSSRSAASGGSRTRHATSGQGRCCRLGKGSASVGVCEQGRRKWGCVNKGGANVGVCEQGGTWEQGGVGRLLSRAQHCCAVQCLEISWPSDCTVGLNRAAEDAMGVVRANALVGVSL